MKEEDITIQDKVLKALYFIGKKASYNEIIDISGLKYFQIAMAIKDLHNRRFIETNHIKLHWENGKMIPPSTTIELRNSEYTFKYLNDRKVLNG